MNKTKNVDIKSCSSNSILWYKNDFRMILFHSGLKKWLWKQKMSYFWLPSTELSCNESKKSFEDVHLHLNMTVLNFTVTYTMKFYHHHHTNDYTWYLELGHGFLSDVFQSNPLHLHIFIHSGALEPVQNCVRKSLMRP